MKVQEDIAINIFTVLLIKLINLPVNRLEKNFEFDFKIQQENMKMLNEELNWFIKSLTTVLSINPGKTQRFII